MRDAPVETVDDHAVRRLDFETMSLEKAGGGVVSVPVGSGGVVVSTCMSLEEAGGGVVSVREQMEIAIIWRLQSYGDCNQRT